MYTNQSTVIYRNIQDFPGYRVGDDGSVWSWRNSYRLTGRRIWKRMQPQMCGTGYFKVLLHRHGKGFNRMIHTLVLEAFVGQCPAGMECRHFPDRCVANNSLANLSWGTPQQNSADKDIHQTKLVGEQGRGAKLTDAKVRRMRRLYATGEVSQYRLAAIFGICQSIVCEVVNRKRWKHVV